MVLDRRFSEMKFSDWESTAGTCSCEGLLLPIEDSYDIRLLIHSMRSLGFPSRDFVHVFFV